jgi:hypothetical protein
MSRIDSRQYKISTGRHFQNGRHNTATIQHCPISHEIIKRKIQIIFLLEIADMTGEIQVYTGTEYYTILINNAISACFENM